METSGKIIGGKYRLLSVLGEGAMGVVYRAEQLDAEGQSLREVALKMIQPKFSPDPNFSRRFLREVRIAARLRSPHSVTVYDTGQAEEGQLYYAMELIGGPTLKDILQRQRPLPVGRVVKIIGQICEALAEAHGLPEPIVHRDLKPANIFIETRQGQDWVQVGDFGIAKMLGEHTSGLTQTGASPGTPRYMAPEQWKGEEVDGRADLYALGIMMYEMLTGSAPFPGGDGPQALMYQHLHATPPVLPHSIPAGIRVKVEQLLSKSPQDRPSNALSVRQALDADMDRNGEQSTILLKQERVASRTESIKRRPSVWRYWIFSGVGVLALLLLVKLLPNIKLLIENRSPETASISSSTPGARTKDVKEKTGAFLMLRTLTGHSDAVQSVAFSPDGQTVASGSSDETVKLWNVQTGALLKTLTGHGDTPVTSARENDILALLRNDAVTSVAFSPDGQTVAGGNGTVTVKVKTWNVQTGTLFKALTKDFLSVTSVAFSPDKRTVVNGNGKDIKLWNLQTGMVLKTLTGHGESVTSVAFSPDGQMLASGSGDNIVKLWNVQTGKLLKTLTTHDGDVTSVVFSPNGQIVASGSWNKVRLWNVQTGALLKTLTVHGDTPVTSAREGDIHAFFKDNAVVTSIAFSPNGEKVVSGSWDETVKLWNAQTGALMQTLTGHGDKVTSVAFSPDGQMIASGSWDKTIKLWRVE